MDMKRQKIAGVLMIVMAVMIGGCFIGRNAFTDKAEKKEEQEAEREAEGRDEVKETEGTDPEAGAVPEEEKDAGAEKKAEDGFELRNLPDAYLELMDTDRKTVAGIIEEWLRENQDYANAAGVEFYDSCEFDQIENKYSFTMKTITGEEGYAEESRILVLDYYTEQEIYQVHP